MLAEASWSQNQSSYLYWINPTGIQRNHADAPLEAQGFYSRDISSPVNPNPVKLDARSIRMTFTAFDEDGDGKLDFEEFSNLLSNRGTSEIVDYHKVDISRLPTLGDRIEITCAVGCRKSVDPVGLQGLLAEYIEETDRWRILLDDKRKVVRLNSDNFKIVSKSPDYIQVTGREGPNNRMNGVYKKGRNLYEGKPFYFKPDDLRKDRAYAIRWFEKHGEWLFDFQGLRSDAGCNAFAAQDVDYPNQVRKNFVLIISCFYDEVTLPWMVYNTSSFAPDEKIDISILPKDVQRLMFLKSDAVYPASTE